MKNCFLIVVFTFFSCQSIRVTEAYKQISKKGHRMGTDYVNYTIIVDASTDFTVNSISLNKDQEEVKFFYEDLSTGLSSYELLNPFPKGTYKFGFRKSDKKSFSSTDFVTLEYLIGKKSFTKKIDIQKSDKTKTNI